MGDQWQLEAVQQQFEVFGSLKKPYDVVAIDDFRALINIVKPVIDQHLQLKNSTKALRKICAEIIKTVDENQKEIKLSFVVIVLNQKSHGSLARIPVFTIISGSQRLFIDINCSVYKNWITFTKSNSLPAGEFCHPVEGHYNVGGRLKIDFSKSPATVNACNSPAIRWGFVGKLFLCVGAVASTFFITIPETMFKRARELCGFVQTFFPNIPFNEFFELASLVQRFKKGMIRPEDFFNGIRLIKGIFETNKDDIAHLWEKVTKHFKSLCNYIREQLQKFFASASLTSQQKFLAITHKVDTEISNLEEEAESKLNAATAYHSMLDCENAESTRGQFPVSMIDRKKTAVPSASMYETNTYVHNVFKNCQSDIISLNGQKNNASELISSKQLYGRGTQELMSVAINIANHLKKENLSDVENVFLSLSSVVKNEYTFKINYYVKILNAARAGAGHEIDIQAFNGSLGIEGDPKNYYWKQTVKSIQEHRFGSQIKNTIDENRKHNEIILIPVSTVQQDSIEGFYRCVGIQGEGRISASVILTTLKKKFSYLNDTDVVINESNPEEILILTDPYTVIVHQKTYDDNTSEGMVFVVKQ